MEPNDFKFNKTAIVFMLLISITFVFFLCTNMKTPLMGEDYALAPQTPYTNWSEYLVGVTNAIKIQSGTWNARIGDQLSIIFLGMNKTVYNIFASFIAIIYFHLIFFFGHARKISIFNTRDLLAFFVPIPIIMAVSPVIGEVFFWCSGSTNYLWASCILLLCAIPYRLYLSGKDANFSKVEVVLYCICCFIASYTNENTVPVIIMFAVTLILIDICKKKIKPPTWLIASFFSFSIGFTTLALAPSTRYRSQFYKTAYNLNDKVTISEFILNCGKVIYKFFQSSAGFIGVFALIAFIYIILCLFNKKNNKEILSKINIENSYLILLSGISAAVLVFAPYIEKRAFLLIQFFLLAETGYLIGEIWSLYEVNNKIKLIMLSVFILVEICTIVFFMHVYNIYEEYYTFDMERKFILIDASNQGAKETGAAYRDINNRILNNREVYIYSTAAGGGGGFYARYYGLESVEWHDYSEKINISELKVVNNNTKVNIENINNIPASDEIFVKKGEQVTISGWAIDELNGKSPDSVLLKFGDEYFGTQSIERTDLVDYFDNPKYLKSGFKGVIDTSKLEIGKYNLNICVIDKDSGTNNIISLEKYINVLE